ncbi:MAG TPA: geranylgeranylglycerol-phosphate geranylgeranyltransferase [Bacteroidia bacterium]|nr:geranylgeranylglycerol-phosphate geranylgeranyltransferase [Bacteroidia bacterium]
MIFLKLIRWPNLLMIALTQFLVRYCLIMPAFIVEYKVLDVFPDHLSKLQFLLLTASTVLIAAGGYIINDIHDTSIDQDNKPGKNKINNGISESAALKYYYVLTSIGILAGFIVAFSIDKFSLGFVPLFAAISLYMYSTFYKKRFLSGNILIAALSALSVLIVGLFEPEFYKSIIYLLWYAVFAFEISLIREIIKDIEDKDGDEKAQSKSLPILYGIKKTKVVVYGLILFMIATILHVLYNYFWNNTVISFWILSGIFLIPLLLLSYMIYIAEEKKDFHFASIFTKVYMSLGIFSLLGFWYYFLR